MSEQSKKSIRKAEAKAAARAAQPQAPAPKPSMAASVDAFMTRHAPSKSDLRWYKFETRLAVIATSLFGLAHLGGLM
jgi:hypothetical protein